MLETLFRAFVVVQPFLWIWILEDDRFEFLSKDNGKHWAWFTYGFVAFIAFIGTYNFSIGFYSTELLAVYSFLVWWGILVLKKNFNWHFREALATSFLLVYLNSWYWESFLHIWAIQENGITRNQIFQLLHLIPGVYFLIRYEFDKNMSVDELAKGFMVSTIIGFMRVYRVWKYLPMVHTEATVYFFNHGLMILNRVICFVFLFNAIINWGMDAREVPQIPPDYVRSR